MRVCKIPFCTKKYKKSGFCYHHYYRYKMYGDPLKTKFIMEHGITCTYTNCNNKYHSRGYCSKHYQRLLFNGDASKLNNMKSERCIINGCNNKYMARGYCSKHYQNNFQKEKRKKLSEKYRLDTRNKLFNLYGHKCACIKCPETNEEFLTLDHINGGGNKHRSHKAVYKVYLDAIKENNPNKYRILCHNCNWAIGVFNKCPHGL